MPNTKPTRKTSSVVRTAVLLVAFSLMAVALPASADSVAIDTSVPCPPTTPSAGFNDIGRLDPTTQLAINCLYGFGITTGTSPTTYSPNETTPRWQMALFLVRQAAVHGISIPAASDQGYTDIGGLPQSTQDAIDQVSQLGVSQGTSATTFSPSQGVSRWQMALFIYRLGVAAGVTFTDDPAHNQFSDIGGTLPEAQTAINALADRHIALGTGENAFTPNLLLTRWEMALFLTRLLAADGVLPPSSTAVRGAQVTASEATNGGLALVLDVGDTISIDFDADVDPPAIGASIDITEAVGGTVIRLTCGTNALCEAIDGNTIRVTVTGALTIVVPGDNSMVDGAGIIQALTGIHSTIGIAVDADLSVPTTRTFTLVTNITLLTNIPLP